MNGYEELSLIGTDNLQEPIYGRYSDDDYSENLDNGAVSDDNLELELVDLAPPRKRKYHRHAPYQVEQLEAFFKTCQHPDEGQRLELSSLLGLQPTQIKFWFQNRRTQLKAQIEHQTGVLLKKENQRLKAQNIVLKCAMRNPSCLDCGGIPLPEDINFEQSKIKMENDRLRDDITYLASWTNSFLGNSSNPTSEFGIGRNTTTMPNVVAKAPFVKAEPWDWKREIQFGRPMLMQLAAVAMEELIKLAEPDTLLWIKGSNGGHDDSLNHLEYARTFLPCIGTTPIGFVRETTRATNVVDINNLVLVETLLDPNRWMEMFPTLVANAAIVDMMSHGLPGTRNGVMQVMQVEFQVISPFVPIRPVKFLRCCEQRGEDTWVIVDVSVDAGLSYACRRLPSGCVIQDVGNGCSKITWVEHSEYDENSIHPLFRPLVKSGMAFGARRCLSSLQRKCESLTMLMPSTISPEKDSVLPPGGKQNMMRVGQRMMDNFCAGVSASTVHKWDKIYMSEMNKDVRVMIRKSVNELWEPSGFVLSAATSVWLPVARHTLFDFLRDEESRSNWDNLSNNWKMGDMIKVTTSQRGAGNCVQLLRAKTSAGNANTMLILQETSNDDSGSLVVYAPVDWISFEKVINGVDASFVSLLPSGFAIFPGQQQKSGNQGEVGSYLTLGFQILVNNNLATGKLTMESVETINNLLSSTLQKIKTCLNLI